MASDSGREIQERRREVELAFTRDGWNETEAPTSSYENRAALALGTPHIFFVQVYNAQDDPADFDYLVTISTGDKAHHVYVTDVGALLELLDTVSSIARAVQEQTTGGVRSAPKAI